MEIKQIVSNTLSSNVYVLKKDNNSIIIDAGSDLQQVLLAVGSTKVQAIFLTHLHFDHTINLSNYVKEFGCPVYLYDKQNVSNPNYVLQPVPSLLQIDSSVFKSLKGQNTVAIKNFQIQCFHTPGHSADSMCFQIENELFSGDTLFYFSIGRTDFPTGNSFQMKQSLKQLKNVNFSTCHCGHGQSSTRSEELENINYFLTKL